jgi:hypothetical protein
MGSDAVEVLKGLMEKASAGHFEVAQMRPEHGTEIVGFVVVARPGLPPDGYFAYLDDAEFFAKARNHLPAILAELAALRQVREELLAALKDIATDSPVSETPTIESILNRAQQIARAAIRKASDPALTEPRP